LGELSKLFNNFNESQLKHNVAHEFGLNPTSGLLTSHSGKSRYMPNSAVLPIG